MRSLDPLALIVVAALLVLAGLGVRVFGASASQGSIARNHYVGLRTPQTMKSDRAWLAGHAAASRLLQVGGNATIVLGLAAALIGSWRRGDSVGLFLLFGATAALLGSVVAAGVRAHIVARSAE